MDNIKLEDGSAFGGTIKYPADLPISRYVGEISAAVRENQVVIVCGTTGSGKTTQLPKILLEAGRGRKGRIGCTQPRRLAAAAMARRLAHELEVNYGTEVGCKVRFDDRTSDKTVVKFMTDGILLAETRHDRALRQYDTLIIDEAHERSLNIDFVLGYLKNLLRKRRDLKVIISSATLDAAQFSEFFAGAPVIEVEGRAYPIEDQFMPPLEDEELSAQIWRGVQFVSDLDRQGDILVFLPGEREIRDAADTLNGRKIFNTEVLPLFGRLSLAEQQKIFNPGRQRRIILATNVAETSITIPRIQYVIDSGLVRLSRYNPRTRIQELQIEQVSQAGARQRRGRCGRLRDGVCIYLYDRETLEGAPAYTDPEICRTSLAGVILQMALLELPHIEKFPLIDPPSAALIREGYRSLLDIAAIDDKGRLTQAGRQLTKFQIDPHFARMICQAEHYKVVPEVMVVSAYLSIQDPRERPADKQQAADQAHRQWHDPDSDFLGILKLWNLIHGESLSQSALRRWCHRNFLNFNRIKEWRNLYMDLWEAASNLDFMQDDLVPFQVFDNYNPDFIHKAILAGLPANIGMWDQEQRYYRGTRDRKFFIFPGSGLFKRQPVPPWLMACSLVETSKVYARQAAVINPEWLEEIAPHLCKKVYDRVSWNPQSGFVYAREQVVSGGLLIHQGRRVHYGPICPEEARRIFIREGVTPGDLPSRGPWLKNHRRMLTNIQKLEEKIRRPGALLNMEAVYQHFDSIIPADVYSSKALDHWQHQNKINLNMAMTDAMYEQLHPIDPKDYPDEMEFAGFRFPIQYLFAPGEENDGMILLAETENINMLPSSILDYLVPGRLPEKIEFMIKSLPKSLRVACNPIADAVAAFCAEEQSPDIPLVEALSEFLSRHTGVSIGRSDFDMDQVPSYLKMRLGELNEHRRIVKYHDQISVSAGGGSRLSAAFSGGTGWIVAGCTEWPPGDLPESVEVSGRTVYPALTDEGKTVGRQLFLNEREALCSQRAGLVRLYKIQHASQMKLFERYLKIPQKLMLNLFTFDRKKSFEKDLIDTAIHDALSGHGSCDIRSAEDFDRRSQYTLENLVEIYERKIKILNELFTQVDQLNSLLAKVPPSGDGSREDVELELQFMFRSGFLWGDTWQVRYPRYLRALVLRLGRLISAPGKDSEKLETVLPFQDRFDAAMRLTEQLDPAGMLYQFWLLLEEFRIQQFAPEVKPLEKVSSQKLAKAWEDLRL